MNKILLNNQYDIRVEELSFLAERARLALASFHQDALEYDCAIIASRLQREAVMRVEKRRSFRPF